MRVEAEVGAVAGVEEEVVAGVAAVGVEVVDAVVVGALVAVIGATEGTIDEIGAETDADEMIAETGTIAETDMIAEEAIRMIEGRAEKAEAAHENDEVVAIEVEAWSASKEARLKREAWKDSLEKVLQGIQCFPKKAFPAVIVVV